MTAIEQYEIGKYDVRLVHIENKSHFFQGNGWRAVVNATSKQEAMKMLQDELQHIKEIESEANDILSGTQRDSKLR
ncbi:MAG: hypothetical protein DRO01_05880 [Thermoproteota archaeon]|nr:MAG: hypothetical protein DRO01_05880 [Candidatus Korarchaeota archaeon]